MVVVYTTPNCQMCHATTRYLTKNGIPHKVEDVTEEVVSEVRERGLNATAPVVVNTMNNDIWTGYNPGKLKELQC